MSSPPIDGSRVEQLEIGASEAVLVACGEQALEADESMASRHLDAPQDQSDLSAFSAARWAWEPQSGQEPRATTVHSARTHSGEHDLKGFEDAWQILAVPD